MAEVLDKALTPKEIAEIFELEIKLVPNYCRNIWGMRYYETFYPLKQLRVKSLLATTIRNMISDANYTFEEEQEVQKNFALHEHLNGIIKPVIDNSYTLPIKGGFIKVFMAFNPEDLTNYLHFCIRIDQLYKESMNE
jgi:hypothetical protein